MIQTAAVGASVLVAGVAMFQLALALGLPMGEATMGGRAPTVDGVLTGGPRAIAAASTVVLLGVAWIVLARANVLPTGPLSEGLVTRATWAIVAFLLLNTVANFAAPHPVERWVMGSITLAVVALVSVVAVRAP